MHILKQLVFFTGIFVVPVSLTAQNKHALIIGINDYYEDNAVKSKISLKGSVNDANAMRQLLVNKFGFKTANIDTIYNAAATRDNIIKGLENKIKQCKKGDMMVFYYSGHGLYLKNAEQKKDSIKRGLSQAMLTSDLYSYRDHFKCFLRDYTLKTYFNYFVDKQVTLTTIFDCCYSGNLAMIDPDAEEPAERTKSVTLDALVLLLVEHSENPEQLIDSITGKTSPALTVCLTNAAGAIMDTLDTDHDGVPDCKDKEKMTETGCLPVNPDGVGKCAFDNALQQTLDKFDAAELAGDNAVAPGTTGQRSFNESEVLRVAEKDSVARPSDRKNSNFLFLSATTDIQKAIEFKYKDNPVQGFFTGALIRVFDKYGVNLPADKLFELVKAEMASLRKDQHPTLYGDPARYKNNLIGIKVK